MAGENLHGQTLHVPDTSSPHTAARTALGVSGSWADRSRPHLVPDKALPISTNPGVTRWQNTPQIPSVYGLVSCLVRAKQDVKSPMGLADHPHRSAQVH